GGEGRSRNRGERAIDAVDAEGGNTATFMSNKTKFAGGIHSYAVGRGSSRKGRTGNRSQDTGAGIDRKSRKAAGVLVTHKQKFMNGIQRHELRSGPGSKWRTGHRRNTARTADCKRGNIAGTGVGHKGKAHRGP